MGEALEAERAGAEVSTVPEKAEAAEAVKLAEGGAWKEAYRSTSTVDAMVSGRAISSDQTGNSIFYWVTEGAGRCGGNGRERGW